MTRLLKLTEENSLKLSTSTGLTKEKLKQLSTVFTDEYMLVYPNKTFQILNTDQVVDRFQKGVGSEERVCRYCGHTIVMDNLKEWYHRENDKYLCYEYYAEPEGG